MTDPAPATDLRRFFLRGKTRYRFVVYAEANASKLPMAVLQEVATAKYIVVPLTEFERDFTREGK